VSLLRKKSQAIFYMSQKLREMKSLQKKWDKEEDDKDGNLSHINVGILIFVKGGYKV
jgi:hypothetical protein